jgi:hypothetical protein
MESMGSMSVGTIDTISKGSVDFSPDKVVRGSKGKLEKEKEKKRDSYDGVKGPALRLEKAKEEQLHREMTRQGQLKNTRIKSMLGKIKIRKGSADSEDDREHETELEKRAKDLRKKRFQSMQIATNTRKSNSGDQDEDDGELLG